MLSRVAIGEGVALGAAAHSTQAPNAAGCVNPKGFIVLASNGTCAKGLSSVHLPLSSEWGASGPAGPPGPTGATGPAGATGATGAIGSQGSVGSAEASGISHYQLITGNATVLPGNAFENKVFAVGPTGTSVLGGRVDVLTDGIVSSDSPYLDPSTGTSSFIGYVRTTSSSQTTARASAICAVVSS